MKHQRVGMDIGNTRTKFACFDEKGEIVELHIWNTLAIKDSLSDWAKGIGPDIRLHIGWISTSQTPEISNWEFWAHFDYPPVFLQINARTALPVEIAYQTPETLGTDRIVAVVAACNVSAKSPVLVIDMGTAITYDFADGEGVYQGGGISPGVQMRFRSLHVFTANLPLIEASEIPTLIGDSTSNCILSGVMNGVLAEVSGIINRYKTDYGESVQIFLTGGDAPFFENHLKNLNFADSNLILKGIYYILTQNSPL